MSSVKAIPDNYPRVLPYLILDGAKEAIEFYTQVFGAKMRGPTMPGPGGKIGHAELAFGDSVIMLADNDAMLGVKTAKELGGCPFTMCVYVEDVDAVFAKAIKAGAKSLDAVKDQFYGDRSGQFEDPWGYRWSPMTHVEDVSPEEMQKRVEALMQAPEA